MARYEIKRWDAMIFGNNPHPFPVIYIKPDEEFIKFAAENNGSVIAKIDGTDTIYDGKAMVGIVSQSSITPNCRPNYFRDTGYFVIFLYGNWHTYPDINQLGWVEITGLKGKYKTKVDIEDVPPFQAPAPVFEMYGDKKEKKIGIFLVIAIVIIIAFIVLGNKFF